MKKSMSILFVLMILLFPACGLLSSWDQEELAGLENRLIAAGHAGTRAVLDSLPIPQNARGPVQDLADYVIVGLGGLAVSILGGKGVKGVANKLKQNGARNG